MIDRDFEQVSEEHMKSMTKPEGPAQEPQSCMVCDNMRRSMGDDAIEATAIFEYERTGHFPNIHRSATPAPSQPAGAREEWMDDAAREFSRTTRTLSDDEIDILADVIARHARQQTAAKDEEIERLNEVIGILHADKTEEENDRVAAERERDSLREALGQILTALKGSDSNRFHCIEVAEKALAGWTGLNQPPAMIGYCDTPHWLDKPTKDHKALQQTPHPLEAGCRQWVAVRAENAALKAGKDGQQ